MAMILSILQKFCTSLVRLQLRVIHTNQVLLTAQDLAVKAIILFYTLPEVQKSALSDVAEMFFFSARKFCTLKETLMPVSRKPLPLQRVLQDVDRNTATAQHNSQFDLRCYKVLTITGLSVDGGEQHLISGCWPSL